MVLPTVQRVYVVSDLHTDQPDNLDAVRAFEAQHDCALIVAGDVSESIEKLTETMELLLERFKLVCFVVGNHDVWVDRERRSAGVTSCDKFKEVTDACARLGVYTNPVEVCCQGKGLWLVPINGWYDASLARDIVGEEPAEALHARWMDNTMCVHHRHASVEKRKRRKRREEKRCTLYDTRGCDAEP